MSLRKRTSRQRSRPRSGAAAVEFALLLPVLMLLVLGCVDFGRFAYTHIAVTNAARAGAGYAVMTPYLPDGEAAWQAAIQQTARDEMAQQTNYNPSNLTATTSVTIEQTGLPRVRVTVSYASFQTIVPWPGIPSSVTVQRAIEMRSIR